MTQLPPTYRRFAELNPAVSTAYESLGEACAQAGPLDDKTRELILRSPWACDSRVACTPTSVARSTGPRRRLRSDMW